MFGFGRFLQGPETDPVTVRRIREAIDNQTEVTVQLINYTKSGMLTVTVQVLCNISKWIADSSHNKALDIP